MFAGMLLRPTLTIYTECPVCGGNAGDPDDHGPDCYFGREGQLRLVKELTGRIGGLWAYDCGANTIKRGGKVVDPAVARTALDLLDAVEAGGARIDEIDGQLCVVRVCPMGVKA